MFITSIQILLLGYIPMVCTDMPLIWDIADRDVGLERIGERWCKWLSMAILTQAIFIFTVMESQNSYTITFSKLSNFPTTSFITINNGNSRQLPCFRYLRQYSFVHCNWNSKKRGLYKYKKAAFVLWIWLILLVRPIGTSSIQSNIKKGYLSWAPDDNSQIDKLLRSFLWESKEVMNGKNID